jgi:hypothetical protein
MTLKEKIVNLLKDQPGLTDREITNILFGKEYPQQSINQSCRNLEQKEIIVRNNEVGKIKNYLLKDKSLIKKVESSIGQNDNNEKLSEDEVKKILEKYLAVNGWSVNISWGKSSGADIVAQKDLKKWVIEVKGCGSSNPMRVNYFLHALGEILQRTDNQETKYSIAFPDLKQFRNLWERLPQVAKDRTRITVLFINYNDSVFEQQ